MTNPESQNTGMDTTQPISRIASSGRFFPTSLITMSASLNAAPVASRILPISAPKIITMPMLVNVPEKPAPITFAIPWILVPSAAVLSTSGIPATSPRSREMVMIEMKGWILNLEMATIMRITAITNTIISGNPVILTPSFKAPALADKL